MVVAGLGSSGDIWATRVGETGDLGDLIEGFADGVVLGLAEQAILEMIGE